MSLVSVIVPIYNCDKYLKKCLDSILSQNYSNFELILIDDGSTDESPLICDRYAELDKRIKVVHQSNGGLSAARNKGLDICRGEYISFIDADDYVAETFLSKMIEAVKESDIAMCDFADFDANGLISDGHNLGDAIIGQNEFWHFNETKQKCLMDVSWNKLYKSDIFQSIRFPNGIIHEDAYVICDIINLCSSIRTVGEVLYYYRQNPTGIMLTKDNKDFKYQLNLLELYSYRMKFFRKVHYELFFDSFNLMFDLLSIYYFKHPIVFKKYLKDLKKAKTQIFKEQAKKKSNMFFIFPRAYSFLKNLYGRCKMHE